MNNVAAKPAARVTPIIDCMVSTLSYWRGDAERAESSARAMALYAMLWYFGTGRAFPGCQRALSHMTKGTLRAYVARVEAAMLARAKAEHGRSSLVPADLTNEILVRAFGPCDDLSAAVERIASHPYGRRLTIG